MGETLIEIRRRIKSTDDLSSVVKTMKAMSAASITSFEEATVALSDYYHTVELALSLCLRSTQPAPLNQSEALPSGFLVLGTDQGMVGQFNERLVDEVVQLTQKAVPSPVIWAVGERVQMRLENAGIPVAHVFQTPSSVEAITSLVTEILLKMEDSRERNEVGAVFLSHNHPIVRGSYEQHVHQLLPLDEQWRKKTLTLPWPTKLLPEMLGDPSDDLATLIREYLFTSIFRSCAESCAAEHAARLVAMQLAEKNINDRQQLLSLDYNHQRQTTIDEELFDLIAGFGAR
ncbi:MAG: F0F1 ATP synthase subunit gamma [Roseibacillus sp.]